LYVKIATAIITIQKFTLSFKFRVQKIGNPHFHTIYQA